MDKIKLLALLGIPVASGQKWLQTELAAAANEILIYGPILESKAAAFARVFTDDLTVVSAGIIKDRLDAISGDIVLRINSPGGDAWEASAIYNLLAERRNSGDNISVMVDGLAASGASFCMCAGNPIEISPIGTVMIHAPQGMAFGDGDQLVKMGEFLQRLAPEVAKVYAAKMGAKDTDVLALLKAETWYTAQDAVDAGLVDSIMKINDEEQPNPETEMEARNQRLQMLASASSLAFSPT